jgi:hypothetical protein
MGPSSTTWPWCRMAPRIRDTAAGARGFYVDWFAVTPHAVPQELIDASRPVDHSFDLHTVNIGAMVCTLS